MALFGSSAHLRAGLRVFVGFCFFFVFLGGFCWFLVVFDVSVVFLRFLVRPIFQDLPGIWVESVKRFDCFLGGGKAHLPAILASSKRALDGFL